MWLLDSAQVNRVVNPAYLIAVMIFGIAMLLFAWEIGNKNAVRLYLVSIPIWLFIEGGSLLAGIRVYDGPVAFVLFVVAFMEDPAWVCFAYLGAERFYKWRWGDDEKKHT